MLYWTPDLWHLISDTGTWHVITWHLIPDTWYMILDNWHAITYLTCFHMVLVHLTWCCDTWQLASYHLILDICYYLVLTHWPDIVTPDWILLHLTPVLHCIFMIITLTGTLIWLIIPLPNIWYSCTLELLYPLSHVPSTVTLFNSTVIPASDRACLVLGWRWCILWSC